MPDCSGLDKVQYLLRPIESFLNRQAYDHPEVLNGDWKPVKVEQPPSKWNSILPAGVKSKDLFGFDKETGKPTEWPLRYGTTNWSLQVKDLQPGKYELRVRSVDRNGFAQPEPRPLLKSGRNGEAIHQFSVVE